MKEEKNLQIIYLKFLLENFYKKKYFLKLSKTKVKVLNQEDIVVAIGIIINQFI